MLVKSSLIRQVAEETGASIEMTKKIIDASLNTIVETVSKGKKVSIAGFGNFYAATRAARKGRNPRTGEEINISEANVPRFKAGKAFKESVSKR